MSLKRPGIRLEPEMRLNLRPEMRLQPEKPLLRLHPDLRFRKPGMRWRLTPDNRPRPRFGARPVSLTRRAEEPDR